MAISTRHFYRHAHLRAAGAGGLARIEAYDNQGPKLNAVITLNPKALETARALDAERKSKGPRSPLHGIPVLLKDNYDTFDMGYHRRLGDAGKLGAAQ